MIENQFFRWVWRFNALAIAGVALIAGVLGLYALTVVLGDLTSQRQVGGLVNLDPAYEETTTEALGYFTPMGAGDLLWAPIERTTVSRLAVSSKSAGAVADYLIYDPATGRSRRLLGRDQALILEVRQLCDPIDQCRQNAPAALLARYVDADTNGDRRLNHLDRQKLALAHPDGAGLTTLAEFDDNLGVSVLSAREAVAVTRTGAGVEALHLDLAGLAINRRAMIEP